MELPAGGSTEKVTWTPCANGHAPELQIAAATGRNQDRVFFLRIDADMKDERLLAHHRSHGAVRLANSRFGTGLQGADGSKLGALDGTAPTSAVADQPWLWLSPTYGQLHTDGHADVPSRTEFVDRDGRQFTYRASAARNACITCLVRMQLLMGMQRQEPEHRVLERRHAAGPAAPRT